MKWLFGILIVIVVFFILQLFTAFSFFKLIFGEFNTIADRQSSNFSQQRCLDHLNSSINSSDSAFYDDNEVRQAIDNCQDLKNKTPAIKKAMARAYVCIGNYSAARRYINEYPTDLSYLQDTITNKQQHPNNYRCLSPVKKNEFELLGNQSPF